MKKLALFVLAAAAMGLASCGGGGNDRTDVPTSAQAVVEKVANSAILINTDGTVLSTEKVNELPYGKILNPALSFKVKASISGVTDTSPYSADKNGVAYVTATLSWTFDSHWSLGDGPDAAHGKARGTYPKAGEDPIESTAKAVISFLDASKEVNYSFLLLAKAS